MAQARAEEHLDPSLRRWSDEARVLPKNAM